MTEPVTLTTYAEYLHPGVAVPEGSVRAVPGRDAARIAREAPASAYAFRFYDIAAAAATIGGVRAKLTSSRLNVSGWYYIDAETLSAADVEALPGDHKVLLDNMRGNRWDAVARCRPGNFQPLRSGDEVVSSHG